MKYWGYEEYNRTREVVGGIKLQDKAKGQTTWWTKRWIQVLESFRIDSRLQRGRTYARKGQVMNIDISPGDISARVQGSTPRPYNVSVEIQPLKPEQWDEVVEKLKEQPLFTAKLLSGEMPQEIEQIFDSVKAPLFPLRHGDLQTKCSCPDYSNPCKHIAAVYYILGAEFDRDPFLLFKLRGMAREDLLERLSISQPVMDEEAEAESQLSEPIETDIDKFWKTSALPGLDTDLKKPPVAAALPKQLGSFPLWRGEHVLMDTLVEVYMHASQTAIENVLNNA